MEAAVWALAASPIGIVVSCLSASLPWRRWEEQVCIRKLNVLIFNFLILATDGTCGPTSWIVGVIVAAALLVVCFCCFGGFCCVRRVARIRRGLLDDY